MSPGGCVSRERGGERSNPGSRDTHHAPSGQGVTAGAFFVKSPARTTTIFDGST